MCFWTHFLLSYKFLAILTVGTFSFPPLKCCIFKYLNSLMSRIFRPLTIYTGYCFAFDAVQLCVLIDLFSTVVLSVLLHLSHPCISVDLIETPCLQHILQRKVYNKTGSKIFACVCFYNEVHRLSRFVFFILVHFYMKIVWQAYTRGSCCTTGMKMHEYINMFNPSSWSHGTEHKITC